MSTSEKDLPYVALDAALKAADAWAALAKKTMADLDEARCRFDEAKEMYDKLETEVADWRKREAKAAAERDALRAELSVVKAAKGAERYPHADLLKQVWSELIDYRGDDWPIVSKYFRGDHDGYACGACGAEGESCDVQHEPTCSAVALQARVEAFIKAAESASSEET